MTEPPGERAKIAQWATEPELSTRVCNMLILEFVDRFGAEHLETLFDREQLPLRPDYLRQPSNFVSVAFVEQLIDLMVLESKDPNFVKVAGARIASREALGFLYYALKAFSSPGVVYHKLVEMLPSVNRVGRFEIERAAPNFIVLRYLSRVTERKRHFCDGRIAQFATVPTLWGLPPAQVTQTACIVDGASSCRYEVRFEDRERQWRRLGGFVGLLAGGTFGAMLETSVGLQLLGFSALGFLTGVVIDLRSRLKQKDEQLTAQEKAVVGSLHDLERRFEQLREAKLELERRVEERTRELTEANHRLNQAVEAQRQMTEAKSRFFANVSHELRTPLTLILSPLEMILSDQNIPERFQSPLDVVRRNALTLLNLVTELLDLARLDSGNERLILSTVDPVELLAQQVESCSLLAKKRGIELRLVAKEGIPKITIDKAKIERIALNLLANALRFALGGNAPIPSVTVTCGTTQDCFFFSVSDTGPGIPAERQSSIFERFQQSSAGYASEHTGSGLGLALVKELTELHQGKVQLTSEEGEGATFKVYLPLRPEVYPSNLVERRQQHRPVNTERRRPTPTPTPPLARDPVSLVMADLELPREQGGMARQDGLQRPQLLVVDDNRELLSLLVGILEPEYQVHTAEDGERAFRLALQNSIDLVLTDSMMPRRNGSQLVSDLRAEPRTASVPIIMLTARAETESLIAGLKGGADDYLAKPFHPEELRVRIAGLLKRRKLEAELLRKNEILKSVNHELIYSEKEVFLQTIEALAMAVEAKDPYTHGHSWRVSFLSEQLARQLGLTELEREQLRVAAILHDVGKIGVPELILNKPGHLDDRERKAVQQHPVIGHRILRLVRGFGKTAQMIQYHHERFDGRGYPEGLVGDAIPLGARIIAVVDTYDAMTSDRSYRKGLPHEVAVAEIRKWTGVQFDPTVAGCFLELWGESPPRFPEVPYTLHDLKSGQTN